MVNNGWAADWSLYDLEDEQQRLESILRKGIRKHGLHRRARYGRRLREVKAAVLGKKLSGEYDKRDEWSDHLFQRG